MSLGDTILADADRLAQFTEEPGAITRTYLSPAHRQAADWLAARMRAAGMASWIDPLGNVVGRYEGTATGAAPILTGSHMDSVRNAGRFDGPLGVLSAIAVVETLHREGTRLTHPLEVVAFGDEEGTRFGVTMIGSSALAGRFDPAWLEAKDATGLTMRSALAEFGGDEQAIPALARISQRPHAYVELHIEQGPVLLTEDLPVAAVTAIAGATRLNIEVAGEANHAGTTPMALRRDALAAAAEMVLAIEGTARETVGLVATVGALSVPDGAANVVPGRVRFTLDIRHADDRVRLDRLAALRAEIEAIAARRGVHVEAVPYYEQSATPCDPRLAAAIADAIGAASQPVRRLVSGAGHDAMVMAHVCPVAMLFVRCGNGGISHHPDETVTAEDADLAARVLLDALRRIDRAVL